MPQLINVNGFNIIPGGDPDYSSVEDLGPEAPTNYVLDPDPDKPVSQFVLETFDIPFSVHTNSGRVLGGSLPGYDIRNADSTTMLRLSLAVELRDNPPPGSGDPAGLGQFAEIELDEFGVARFYVVGEDLAVDLDVRYCIPTSQVNNPADLVIVRGYDPPPKRVLRDPFNGLKNAEAMDYSECASDSCDEDAVGKYASVSYDDPLLDQTYLDDVVNSYELQAFESLVGYLVDLDLPDGADEDDPNYTPGLKVTFGDTTKEYITLPVSLFSNAVYNGTVGVVGGTGGGASAGFGNTGGSIAVSTSAPGSKAGACSQTDTTVVGARVIIPVERFQRLNKYGDLESDLLSVQEVVFSGQKIVLARTFGNQVAIFVQPDKELISLQQGKNWTWTVDAAGNLILEFLSYIEDAYTAAIWQLYQGGQPGIEAALYTTDSPNQPFEVGSATFNHLIANIGDRLGYRSINGKMCVVVERKRPSIDIYDPSGRAADIARKLVGDSQSGAHIAQTNAQRAVNGPGRSPVGNGAYGVTYRPIVIVDEPAPIAYAANEPLQSIDFQTGLPGSRVLPAEGIIDQANGIVDGDPNTTQDLSDSDLAILQDNTNGATIDITLPFATEDECLEIAKNFLALQQEIVTTQSIILGPLSEPKLGQALPNGAIINEINYSYSDASQYLITITAGPKYLTAGSFQDSQYQLQTEDVTREGVVLQDLGNGAEYIVRVEGIGEMKALSMILDEITAGDKVNVRIFNNPVERR